MVSVALQASVGAAVLLALLSDAADAIVQNVYENEACTGTPIETNSFSDGVCSLGGLVYTCISDLTCLQITTRTFESSEKQLSSSWNCTGGTVVTSTAYPCNECTGGSDTSVSTIVKGCATNEPAILTCFGSGWCAGECNNDSGNLTVGCIISDNSSSVNTEIVPCSAVMMQDYADYETCSGSVQSQVVYAAGVCTGGVLWQC